MKYNILDKIRPRKIEPIVDWAQKHVIFGVDTNVAKKGNLILRPYQIPILEAADNKEVREIVVSGVQQCGKSLLWKIITLYKAYNGGLSAIVIYPNEKEALESNRDTLEPLIRRIPSLAIDLNKPKCKTANSYHLTENNSIIYFQGGGTQVLSKTCNYAVMDEVDFHNLAGIGQGSEASVINGEETKNVDNIQALRARMATYRDSSLLYVSSTPTTANGMINRQWLNSSQGLYHLSCISCGYLTPCTQLAFNSKDGKLSGLQWEKSEDGVTVVEASIKYICPQCGFKHDYSQAEKMVELGKYVHKQKDNHRQVGFRFSALCAPEVHDWYKIATAQENNLTVKDRQYFHNFILGKPFTAGKYDLPKLSEQYITITKHAKPFPPEGIITSVFASVDVQGFGSGGNYFVTVIRGFDEKGNSYLLYFGRCKDLNELTQVVDAKYMGLPVTIGCIDHGGFDHSKTALLNWVLSRRNWYWAKGDTQHKEAQVRGWSLSANVTKLILHNKYNYQVILLDAIYTRTTDSGDYYWSIPEGLNVAEDMMSAEGKAYITQIKAMQPRERKLNGDSFENWLPNSTDRHDYWDAEQQICLLLDVVKRPPLPVIWAKGNMPLFLRKELINEINRAQTAKKMAENTNIKK